MSSSNRGIPFRWRLEISDRQRLLMTLSSHKAIKTFSQKVRRNIFIEDIEKSGAEDTLEFSESDIICFPAHHKNSDQWLLFTLDLKIKELACWDSFSGGTKSFSQ